MDWVGGNRPLSRMLRRCAAGLLVCLLLGCSQNDKSKLIGSAPPRDTFDPIRNVDLGAHFPAAPDRPPASPRESAEPLLFPGAPSDPAAPSSDPPGMRVASAEPAALVRGAVVDINFDGADIQNVAKALLGDTLGLNFMVDPRVQGNVTLASTGPIARQDVLPVFESALRMSNAAIVREGNLVKIVPVAEGLITR